MNARTVSGGTFAVVAFLAIAAIAVAAVAGRSAAQPDRPAHVVDAVSSPPLTLGPIGVDVPSQWRRTPVGARGLAQPARSPALAFDPAPGLSAQVLLTLTPLSAGSSPTLLPAGVLSAIAEPPRSPKRVQLAGHQAWRYSGLPMVRHHATIDVTVLPTNAGIVAVACMSPEMMSVITSNCASDVSLRLNGVPATAPAADLVLRLRLPSAIAHLDAERVRERAALRAARSPSAQAAIADRLAGAYTTSARALGPMRDSPAFADLATALGRGAGSYRYLSRTAATRDRAGFAHAARAVEVADARLRTSLAALARSD